MIEHVLTDADSLQSLALTYLKDATRWGEIADYNRLRYPYILRSKEDIKDFFGSGYITIVRSGYQNEALIQKGWTFKTESSLLTGNTVRVFEVIEDTVIPAGVQQYDVPLRCGIIPSFGNVMEYTITEAGDNTVQLSGIQYLSIYNELKFSGGRTLDVRITGESIYIPVASTIMAPEDAIKMLSFLGGEDILLDDTGNLIIEDGGDLASISGTNNIRYAVASRLKSEINDIAQHPEYGTDLQDLIGSPNISNREKLMEIAVYRSLAQESRITEVSIVSLTVTGTSVLLSLTYKLSMNGASDSITLSL